MEEEIRFVMKNDTLELLSLPKGNKARLVGKGYNQKTAIDYDEVFAPVACLETIRFSLAAQHKWRIHQMDMKSAFLNGVLENKVYIEQTLGYKVKGEENKVLI